MIQTKTQCGVAVYCPDFRPAFLRFFVVSGEVAAIASVVDFAGCDFIGSVDGNNSAVGSGDTGVGFRCARPACDNCDGFASKTPEANGFFSYTGSQKPAAAICPIMWSVSSNLSPGEILPCRGLENAFIALANIINPQNKKGRECDPLLYQCRD
jgi:hypothetical protein